MIIDVVPQCDVLGYLFLHKSVESHACQFAKEADEQATAMYPKNKTKKGLTHVGSKLDCLKLKERNNVSCIAIQDKSIVQTNQSSLINKIK